MDICFHGRTSVSPVWKPRCDSSVADGLFKKLEEDCDDWQLQSRWFHYLDGVWGPHTMDRFANDLNTHLPVFYSKRCSGTSGIDTFMVCWVGQIDSVHLFP